MLRADRTHRTGAVASDDALYSSLLRALSDFSSMAAEDVAADLGPEFLEKIHGHGERNLFGRIAEGVGRNIVMAGEPERRDRRRAIVCAQVGDVQRRMALVIVSKEAVSDGVNGAALEPVLRAGDVAHIFVENCCDRRLNSPLKDGAG